MCVGISHRGTGSPFPSVRAHAAVMEMMEVRAYQWRPTQTQSKPTKPNQTKPNQKKKIAIGAPVLRAFDFWECGTKGEIGSGFGIHNREGNQVVGLE